MIDVDSERENQIIFNKPNDFVMPTEEDKIKDVVIDDLKTLAHGLGCMIRIAEKRGYGSAEQMISDTIELLKDYYPQPNDEVSGEIETPSTEE